MKIARAFVRPEALTRLDEIRTQAKRFIEESPTARRMVVECFDRVEEMLRERIRWEDEDRNEAIIELATLCAEQGVAIHPKSARTRNALRLHDAPPVVVAPEGLLDARAADVEEAFVFAHVPPALACRLKLDWSTTRYGRIPGDATDDDVREYGRRILQGMQGKVDAGELLSRESVWIAAGPIDPTIPGQMLNAWDQDQVARGIYWLTGLADVDTPVPFIPLGEDADPIRTKAWWERYQGGRRLDGFERSQALRLGLLDDKHHALLSEIDASRYFDWLKDKVQREDVLTIPWGAKNASRAKKAKSGEPQWKLVQRKLIAKLARGEPYISIPVLEAETRAKEGLVRKAIRESEALTEWKAAGKSKGRMKLTALSDVHSDRTAQSREAAPEEVAIANEAASEHALEALIAEQEAEMRLETTRPARCARARARSGA